MQRHFTATAFVIDSSNRTLLMWHKRLERWMPPGGHVDTNELPEETAKRECKEETGLDVEIIGDAQADVFGQNRHEGRLLKKPFAMLLEEIPASETRGESAHQHMDFVFLARPLDDTQLLHLQQEEGSQLRWFTRADVEALNDTSEIYANVKAYILEILSV